MREIVVSASGLVIQQIVETIEQINDELGTDIRVEEATGIREDLQAISESTERICNALLEEQQPGHS